MTSDNQMMANQQNALLGGVKTEMGKAISRLNAIKHGVLSDFVLPEEEDEVVAISEAYKEEYDPQTLTEHILVERAALYTLRLRRSGRAEKEHLLKILNPRITKSPFEEIQRNWVQGEVIEEGYNPKFSSENVRQLDETFLRYETQLERSLFRIIHELQRLKATKDGKEVQLPVAVDVSVDRTPSEREE